jgi:hypothetical protein
MNYDKPLVKIVVLSGALGVGVSPLFAQTAPGGTGPAMPSNPGVQQPSPTFPQPGQTVPQPAQPGVPAQPAPGVPQTDRFPGQPTPGLPSTEPVPGQPAPIPGQPGTIPEKLDQPRPTTPPVTPDTRMERGPGSGARLDGERRSITPPAPPTVPGAGQTGTPNTEGSLNR